MKILRYEPKPFAQEHIVAAGGSGVDFQRPLHCRVSGFVQSCAAPNCQVVLVQPQADDPAQEVEHRCDQLIDGRSTDGVVAALAQHAGTVHPCRGVEVGIPAGCTARSRGAVEGAVRA